MTGPSPEALLVQALKAITEVATLCGGRIATRLSGTYPAVRVTLTGGIGRSVSATGFPTLQWEAWGNGTDAAAQIQASDLAREIEAAVDDGRLAGVYTSGTIASAWVDGRMSHSADTTSNRERYLGTIGLIAQ